MSQSGQAYRLGQQVAGRIEKLLSYGVFVRLEDGAQAYIRRRELTWAGNIDPHELWQEGQKIEGKVLKLAEPGQCLELSHRATLTDPWEKFVSQSQPGDVIQGAVKSLSRHGIFVEVTPGIDGLIPLRDLAPWEVSQPGDMLWVGDTVEAVITSLDRQNRRLRLSIQARWRQVAVVSQMMEHLNLSPGLDSGPGDSPAKDLPSESETALPTYHGVGRILVVDDHEEVRLPLVEWLRHRGCEVDHAKDAEEAAEKVQKEIYNLLFIDLNLPGMDGLTLLRQIKGQGLKGHAALMSTSEWLGERSSEIEDIGVVEVFVKPLELDEIEHLLGRVEQKEELPPWRMAPASADGKAPESFYRLANAVRSSSSLAEQLRAGLQQLEAATPAEVGLIFNLNPISQAVSITAEAGKTQLINVEAMHMLGASPVREVIKEGEQILENQMTGKVRDRFRKLLDLLPFESCIGIPIEVSGGVHRALFLFQRQPNAFNRYHLRDALAASALFAVTIEREAIEQRSRALNKLFLTGQLASGFGHEVYNKMSGLEIQLRNLQTDCYLSEDQAHSLSEIQQAADRLLETFYDLKQTVELFQQLMRAEDDQEVSLNEVIQKIVTLLKPVMRKEKVRLETELDPHLPNTAGSAVRLQQAFLNIMLNAMQHMPQKPGGSRCLSITTCCQIKNKERPLEIRFSDTGAGIHRQLWEKIFELGFTTRLGGTGQGLYIARSLVESVGGTIRVERSLIPLGTIFVVALPLGQPYGRAR